MVLVDTSVWVDHFRQGIPLLEDILSSGQATTHQFIIGELACGNLKNRTQILNLFSDLPSLKTATHEEALHFIEIHSLSGAGIGWIDVHLLASAILSHTPLWTRDKKLNTIAEELGIAGKE